MNSFSTKNNIAEKQYIADMPDRNLLTCIFNFLTMIDFGTRNATSWRSMHQSIFGEIIPARCEWHNPKDIIKVLNKIGLPENSNYTFMPDGGGLTLRSGSFAANEEECIMLDFDTKYLVKPIKLSYEFIDDNLEWNYFLLETAELKPSGIYDNLLSDQWKEDLIDLGDGEYIDGNFWYNREELEFPIPDSAIFFRRVFRGGSFAIFKKASRYNHIQATADGRHQTMGAVNFNKHVIDLYERNGNEQIIYPVWPDKEA